MNQATPPFEARASHPDIELDDSVANPVRSDMSRPPIRQLLIESPWRQVGPSMLVLVALAVVGYVGHRTGWKVPRFSELFGLSRADESSWCNEHNVPEAECIACH